MLQSGERFNSSPTAATLIDPGESYTLETAGLEPNHYVYYCALHPWMTDSFTVTPRP